MSAFYIIKVQGLFKQYYSESIKENMLEKQPEFTAMLRYAKAFESIEEAIKLIEEKAFESCHVVDRFGRSTDK